MGCIGRLQWLIHWESISFTGSGPQSTSSRSMPALCRFDMYPLFNNVGFPSTSIHAIGRINASRNDETISIVHKAQTLYKAERADLQKMWSETSFRMQSIRDDSIAADEEFALILISDKSQTGLFYDLNFIPSPLLTSPADLIAASIFDVCCYLSNGSHPELSLGSFASFSATPGRGNLRMPSTSSRTTAQSSAPISTPSPPSISFLTPDAETTLRHPCSPGSTC